MRDILKVVFVLSVLSVVLFNTIPVIADEGGEPEGPWNSSIGLAYMTTRGNSETNNLAMSYESIYEQAKSKWGVWANVAWASTGGDNVANRGGVVTQYDYFQSERIFYFGKFGVEYDEQADLDLRTSPGGGIGFVVYKEEKTSLTAGAGASYVTDKFNDGTDESRGMLALSEEWAIALTSTASLLQKFNIQNNFEDFGDYLIDLEVSLSTKVSDQLSLKASLLDKYDSTPHVAVVALKKNDLTFLTSLNYSF